MKTVKDPGLGSKFQKPLNRLMNRDGSYNIIRRGGLTPWQDFYKYLLEIPLYKFLFFTGLIYIIINLIFTSLYLLIGIDQLRGVPTNQPPFFSAFFFSTQTFTTVGYGSVSPWKTGAEIIAMIEAFVGLLSFALATGLLYGRFSRPNSRIAFTKNAIITPFENEKALMFKLVNLRNNVLLNSKIKVFLSLDKIEGTNNFNKDYFQLTLETDSITFFPLTWTIVHKITDDSPLHNLSLDEIKLKKAEIFVLIETFDETFSQEIVQKHSYASEDWVENVKFESNFRPNANDQLELFINELDNYTTL
ncbi:MAG: ion transporter [Flavobacteriia bacterium]|nr:ion transporter [Flavobacteriia bacterium]